MFNKIEADKWRHFFVGIIMGAVLQGFSSFLLRSNLLLATAIAFTILLAISYGFELFSKLTGLGRYDFIDAVASAIGGVIGMALMIVAELYIFH